MTRKGNKLVRDKKENGQTELKFKDNENFYDNAVCNAMLNINQYLAVDFYEWDVLNIIHIVHLLQPTGRH